VVLEQDSNGFSADPGDQLTFHGFFGDQPHRPTRIAVRRGGAYHGNDALLAGLVQQFHGAGALLVVQGALQSPLLITMADLTDGLGGDGKRSGNPWSRHTLCQLQQGQGPEYHSHLLHPTTDEFSQLLPVMFGDGNLQSRAGHTPSMLQNAEV
jgi:hypothetical protein